MLRVTIAGLLTRRLRMVLTAVTIAIGVALVAGTFMLTDSLQAVLGAPAAAAAGQVVVQPAGANGGKGPAASLPAALADRIRAVPGVASVQGLVTAAKVMLIGKEGRPIARVRAVSLLLSYPAIKPLTAQYTIQSGHPPSGPGEAVLDTATARRLGYRPGDPISVVTAHGVRKLTVVGTVALGRVAGVVAEQIASFDTPTVLVVQPATAQQLAGLAGRFTEIDVLPAAGMSGATLTARISRLLPPGTVALTSQQAAAQQAASAQGYIGNLRSYLFAFCAIALLVASFVIASTFSILAAQRTRELALLRVIGASRGQLLRSALTEAAILGLTASVLGLGLGFGAAAGLRGLIGVVGGTLPPGAVMLAPRTTAVSLATGTLVTIAAALRPTRRAARVQPVRALRGALPAAVRHSRGRATAALAAIAAATALIVTGLRSDSSQAAVFVGAGGLLGAAAAVVAGPLLAGPLARLLVPPLAPGRGSRRPGRVSSQLARDNSARNPGRTAAAAPTLTIGLAAAAAVSVIATSARASAQDAITATSRADLYLQGSISPGLARAVTAQPGAVAARVDDPLAEVAGSPARVAGIDPAAAALISFGVRTGTLTALHGNALFVSTVQAARHGWRLGSTVPVIFDQGPSRTFVVAGTFADKRLLGDDYLMAISTLFRDKPDEQASAGLLLVRARPGTLAALRAAIAALLRSQPEVIVQAPAQYQAAQSADLGDLNHVLGLLVALIALTELIAALGIASAQALAVTERTREFAVMRAIGLTRHQLAAMVRAESVLTCLLGVLPGVVIGVTSGAALAAALTRAQTGVSTVRVPLTPLAAALAVTCAAALLAGMVPARQAGRAAIIPSSAG